jgi:hypothetical protein
VNVPCTVSWETLMTRPSSAQRGVVGAGVGAGVGCGVGGSGGATLTFTISMHTGEDEPLQEILTKKLSSVVELPAE